MFFKLGYSNWLLICSLGRAFRIPYILVGRDVPQLELSRGFRQPAGALERRLR